MSMKAADTRDAALGALLGCVIGDAAGATLEFLGHTPTPAEVERAMAMPGGGWLGVAPGQITDDGELTLSLALALAEAGPFDLERVARRYAQWYDSGPFDVGNATSLSIGAPKRTDGLAVARAEGFAAAMSRAAARHNLGSKANGSLMRAVPLGIWGHRLADAALARCTEADCGLSHPNPSCLGAVTCYVLALAHLVARPGDVDGAIRRATDWAESNEVEEVRGWLADAQAGERVAYEPKIGFVRIAFTHAFRHLRLGSAYESAIRETLLGGGDTDTNACIVGGLVGAACGARSIPDAMRGPVLSCDTLRGRPRPEFLSTRQVPGLVDRLLAAAPAE